MNPNMTDAAELIPALTQKKITVCSAESCTGGLIAKLLTDIPGSSAVLLGAFVTYTNEVKERLLGVTPELIREHTEVSHACAAAMAEGARRQLGAALAVSTTGYAGPGGGTERDPVGTVYIGLSSPRGTRTERFCAPAGSTREQVRSAAAFRALALLAEEAELLSAP